MSDYDFKQLNDKEFEILCADLIGEEQGCRIERFKPGKDQGVDGRYFISKSEEVILQCKHWCNTPLSQLLLALKTTEKNKLDKLKPHRYLLALSNPLSRINKKSIQAMLFPYIVNESDIYGKEDLNDLLKKHIKIERRHYKLWLQSASVLGHVFNAAIIGRSAFSLEEIISSSARYVVTDNHNAALAALEKLGVVIITGEPGIGKTTLADHLCLYYVANGFAFIKIAEDISEAESVFDRDSKQLFYFDDFLGRNYLDALRGHEANHITQFIRRVSHNKNKRFILTSRSTILNQGKLLSDKFDHDNIQKNEYELRIQSLSEMDKAQILYNHIWHSGLGVDYVEQLYVDRRYREVISHRNFNPRLISYITDASRLAGCSAGKYWQYVVESLVNPSQIWENPFVAQQDDFGRAIVLLVVLNANSLREDILSEAYRRYTVLPANHNLQGRGDFQTNMRQLTGAFLNRRLGSSGSPLVDLFNPSIADYVLQRYANDVVTIRYGLLCLRTYQSLGTLKSLKDNGRLSLAQALSISEAILNESATSAFSGFTVEYISFLCGLHKEWSGAGFKPADSFVCATKFLLQSGEATSESFRLIEFSVVCGLIDPKQALKYVDSNIQDVLSDDEIRACFSLFDVMSDTVDGYQNSINSAVEHVHELIADNINEFIEVDVAFSKVDYEDDRGAFRELERLLTDKLLDLGLPYSANDAASLLDSYDVAHELERYFINSCDGDDRVPTAVPTNFFDEIDDLFDRG